MTPPVNSIAVNELAEFFNRHHDKLVCTASGKGEPNVSLMGTPRITSDGLIEFDISDAISVTLQNIRENRNVLFLAYVPGERARDYTGARISAVVTAIETSGNKFNEVRNRIAAKHGEAKAAELVATISCTITRVRPIVDRGQRWNECPF